MLSAQGARRLQRIKECRADQERRDRAMAEKEVRRAMQTAEIKSPPPVPRTGIRWSSTFWDELEREAGRPYNAFTEVMSPVDLDDIPVNMDSPVDRSFPMLPTIDAAPVVDRSAVAFNIAPNGATMAMDEAGNVVGVRPPPGVDLSTYAAACTELNECFTQVGESLVPDESKRATIDRLYPIVCGKPLVWPDNIASRPKKKAQKSQEGYEERVREQRVRAAVNAARELQEKKKIMSLCEVIQARKADADAAAAAVAYPSSNPSKVWPSMPGGMLGAVSPPAAPSKTGLWASPEDLKRRQFAGGVKRALELDSPGKTLSPADIQAGGSTTDSEFDKVEVTETRGGCGSPDFVDGFDAPDEPGTAGVLKPKPCNAFGPGGDYFLDQDSEPEEDSMWM